MRGGEARCECEIFNKPGSDGVRGRLAGVNRHSARRESEARPKARVVCCRPTEDAFELHQGPCATKLVSFDTRAPEHTPCFERTPEPLVSQPDYSLVFFFGGALPRAPVEPWQRRVRPTDRRTRQKRGQGAVINFGRTWRVPPPCHQSGESRVRPHLRVPPPSPNNLYIKINLGPSRVANRGLEGAPLVILHPPSGIKL